MALVVYQGPGAVPSIRNDEGIGNDHTVVTGKRFVGLVSYLKLFFNHYSYDSAFILGKSRSYMV